jgi:ElaB/YqjD/DUF883 family membrane-anchored ribosome-binding protein
VLVNRFANRLQEFDGKIEIFQPPGLAGVTKEQPMNSETRAAKDKLMEDLKAVMHDAEELLKATAGQTGEKISAVRARAEENLREVRRKLGEMEDDLMEQARAAVKGADDLVHEKPWQSIAVAAGVAFLLGLLAGRR